ncbi:hypothetical protein Goarm_000770 [Gossypium armourianum]|uniref:Uncharacterized protein n=1 Tax=Gossypium armourianum TaxID=34283 RepID=A0A7J9KAV2_9ROSI|nr:hypothetical protein [Gossypium armourianum]
MLLRMFAFGGRTLGYS